MWRELCAVVLSLSLGAPALAQGKKKPKDDSVALAQKAFDEAETHYKLQEYERALEGYKEAYRLLKDPVLLFNLGQCYRALKRYDEAKTSYQLFLRESPESPVAGAVRATIDEIDREIAASQAPPDQPGPVSPSTGPIVPLEVREERAPTRPSPGRPWILAAAGAAAGAAALGGASLAISLGARRETQVDDLREAPPGEELAAAAARSRALALSADVIAVGAVGLGLFGILKHQTRTSEPAASLALAPRGALVTLRW